MKLVHALLSLFVLAASPFAGGPEVHVDAVLGDDVLGTGSPTAPFRTITQAIASLGGAADATVHVAAGVYGPTLGESFPLVMPSGMSLLGAGAHQTTITGEGSGTLLQLGRKALVSDVTVRRGDIGVRSLTSPFSQDFRYLRRVALRDNVVGAHCQDDIHSDSGFALVSCAVINNDVGIRHYSLDNDFQSTTVLLYGTTVTNNADAIEFQGFGELFLGAFDSVVRGNGDDSLAPYTGSIFPGITGNDLGDPTFVGVDGNVDVDPGLVALGLADAHLLGTSALRDAPAPAVVWPPAAQYVSPALWTWEAAYADVGDLDGDPRPIGAATDIGADEYASPSLYPWGSAKLGAAIELAVQAEPAEIVYLAASAAVFGAPVGGFLWLQPPLVVLPAVTAGSEGVGTLTVPLPSDPGLAGFDLYLQALTVGSGGFAGSLPDHLRILP